MRRSILDAKFTVLPIAVYSNRSGRSDAADDCWSRVDAYSDGERPFSFERQISIELRQ